MNIKTGTEMFGSIVNPKPVEKAHSTSDNAEPSSNLLSKTSPILLLGLGVGLSALLYFAGKKVDENV